MISKIYFGFIFIGLYFAVVGALVDQAKRPWVPYWTTEEIYVATRFGMVCITQDVCPFNGIMKRYEDSGHGETHKPDQGPLASKEDLDRLKEIVREELNKLEAKNDKH